MLQNRQDCKQKFIYSFIQPHKSTFDRPSNSCFSLLKRSFKLSQQNLKFCPIISTEFKFGSSINKIKILPDFKFCLNIYLNVAKYEH